jgi:LL-diaminopimelate aminotransferase
VTIRASKRVQSIGGYAFAEVDKLVGELKARKVDVIDFGVGDPTIATPAFIREACKAALDRRAEAGYPSYIGQAEFRRAAADWLRRRFRVSLDPETQVTSTIGSKEAVFHLHEGFVDPGDVVLIPSPGYPPYARGTLFAEGRPFFLPIVAENGFLPDLDAVPADVVRQARVLWINYPNSPSGRIALPEFFERVIDFGRRHNVLVASDEAYIDIYFGRESPHSILEYGVEGVLAFFSLSKRSAMTGWRVGFVAGDAAAVQVLRKVKTNIDSGTPQFIQDAAAAALADERHVAEMRAEYLQKRDIICDALASIGLDDCRPESTLYVWQRVPKRMTSADFAMALLAPEIALVVTPGAWISDPTFDGRNPGEGYVRLALVPSLERTREAAQRLKRLKF